MDQGRTAIVRTDGGLTLMLTTRRMPPFSLRQLTTFGINPAEFDIRVCLLDIRCLRRSSCDCSYHIA